MKKHFEIRKIPVRPGFSSFCTAKKLGNPGLTAIFLFLCLCVSAYAAGEYRTVEVEFLRITIDAEWGLQGATGYVPVRFDITNLGDDRVIEITGSGSRWFRYASSGAGTLDVRQTVGLKRGDRVRLTIPVPTFADSENIQFQVREGRRILESFNYNTFQSGKILDESPVLIVAALDSSSTVRSAANDWLRSAASPYYVRGSAPKLDFILDPTRVPSNWLGFTSLRAVAFGAQEWKLMNESQKNALLAWTASGGELIFVDGDLKTLFPDRQSAGVLAYARYFFGHIHFPTSAEINAKPFEETLSEMRSRVPNSFLALPVSRSPNWGLIEERGFRLPIPGVDGIPARRYFVILILFTVLIGPVNYIVLWRRHQQALLVLTVPLISGLFIAVLATYAIAGEGFGVRGRAETFTMLDQDTKKAATRATVSLYAAGMAPSGGLRFPRDIAVFPLGADGRGSRGNEGLDLTESQQFYAGMIQARMPSNFEQVGFRPARERVSFSRDANGMTVLNGLGATITQLLYRENGKAYSLNSPLRAGEKGVLDSKGLDTSRYPERVQQAIVNQPDDSYVAVLERSPFWEPGVANIDERGSFHAVLGYLEARP